MKKLPLGISDFDRIIREDYYFFDNSRYIQTVEDQGSFIIMLRPRRMGKTLFSNMMMSYYDLSKKDKFDSLFGNLWIGQHSTEWANKFIVLGLDFSKVKYDSKDLDANFESYFKRKLIEIFIQYGDYFSQYEKDMISSMQNAKDAIGLLVTVVHSKGDYIYLFIDEYDNFTNIVLTEKGVNAHHDITHGQGFYRDFFKACKGTFDRIYMTGISPVTYDDLTSGFNIAQIIALSPRFNEMIGVTEDNLRIMIDYYRNEGQIHRDTDAIIAEMKPWYDNFCFAPECYGEDSPIYNTNMTVQYMVKITERDRTPEDMIDYAARTDYNKLDFLVNADEENKTARYEVIREICANGYTSGRVRPQFPASDVGREEYFKSMLYYFGTLTFGSWNEWGEHKLIVPNKTMGELYLTYMSNIILAQNNEVERRKSALAIDIRNAAVGGDWQTLVKTIGELYSDYSSVRDTVRCEADVQGFLRGLLCLNSYFDVWPELELGHGYCDILLLPNSAPRCATKHSYILEIKYMKTGEKDVQAKVEEACNQLRRYISDKHLTDSRLLRGSDLTPIYLIFQGQHLLCSGICNDINIEN